MSQETGIHRQAAFHKIFSQFEDIVLWNTLAPSTFLVLPNHLFRTDYPVVFLSCIIVLPNMNILYCFAHLQGKYYKKELHHSLPFFPQNLIGSALPKSIINIYIQTLCIKIPLATFYPGLWRIAQKENQVTVWALKSTQITLLLWFNVSKVI